MEPPSAGAVEDALRRLLESSQFAGSPRARRFIKFIVEAALGGRGDGLKEYVLGVEVFDRAKSFDPRIDTIVRVEAVKLRRRLVAYYRGPGRRDTLVIEVPKGGYVPTFRNRPCARPQSAASYTCSQERGFSLRKVSDSAFTVFPGGIAARDLSVESLAEIGHHLLAQQTTDSLAHAAELFRECVLREPEHAISHMGLADCYFLQSALGQLAPAQSRRRCVALATRARALDPNSADIQLGYARLANCYEWNWEAAEIAHQRALELAPDSARAHGWYGGYLTRKGEVDRGIREIQLALSLDPISALPWSLLADALYLAEDFNGCAATGIKGLVLHPNDWLLHSIMSKASLALGDCASSLMHSNQAARAYGNRENVMILGDLGYILAVSNRKDAARQVLRRLERRRLSGHVSAVILARICTALGREEDALGWLERGCDDRDVFMNSISSDIRLAPLRRYTRFHAVIEEIRF
jgi:tetratricopeptide (TPR) repeat protein